MSITRVRYRETQVLRAADLAAEQAHRIAMRRRHQIGGHGWGVVSGLDLVERVTGIVVPAGLAIDGYGRELILSRAYSLPETAFDVPNDGAIDLWLNYEIEPLTQRGRGSRPCGPGSHARWEQRARVSWTPASTVNPRMPPSVLTGDLDFAPHELPPTDPDQRWPVYLGRVTRVEAEGASTYSIDMSRRPIATLVGRLVRSPAGDAELQVAGELETDIQRFAVRIKDGTGSLVERLTINRRGAWTIRGDVTVDRPARIVLFPDADTGQPARFVRFQPAMPLKEEPLAWSAYRTQTEVQGATEDEKIQLPQLRFETYNPGQQGDPDRYRLAIGHREDATFTPCLTVRSDCTVIVNNLRVQGQIVELPIPADPTDPRFLAALASGFAGGQSAGSGTDPFITGALAVSIEADDPVDPDAEFELTITLDNPSPVRVEDIEVFVNLNVGGAVTAPAVIGTVGSIASGNDATVGPTTLTVPDTTETEMLVGVLARGIGSLGQYVFGIAGETVTIEQGGVE